MNSASIIGRLTKDVELRYTPNGVAVASFTVAVNRSFTKENGEREADFINCIAWKKTAETFANHVKKGHQVGITGRIQTRSYDGQDGKKVYITEIVVENLTFIEKKQNEKPLPEEPYSRTTNNTNYEQNQSNPFTSQFSNQQQETKTSAYDINDDDLPF